MRPVEVVNAKDPEHDFNALPGLMNTDEKRVCFFATISDVVGGWIRSSGWILSGDTYWNDYIREIPSEYVGFLQMPATPVSDEDWDKTREEFANFEKQVKMARRMAWNLARCLDREPRP